jgi:glycosyltransferase involved in cell wall biosynthesis
MKIALVSTPFLAVPPKEYGGTELVIYELAEGLHERGHEVTVFATGDSAVSCQARWLYPNAQWPPNQFADINHATWALSQIAAGTFDIVHTHTASALALTRFLPEIPMVYTLRHERVDVLSSFYEHFPDVRFVAISQDQRSREVSLPDCTVIHHGLDADRYEYAARSHSYVCFIGRLARVKGPHIAIDSALKAGREIHVAGEVHPVDSDFAVQELDRRFEQPGVVRLGPVGMAAKIELLRDAAALLAPVVWNEPFGLVLIEAMLSGCPVVGFPRGSLPELVEQGVTGFLVSSEEEMTQLIRPGGELDSFDRMRCRQRATERFGRDAMVEAHERLYETTNVDPHKRIRIWA